MDTVKYGYDEAEDDFIYRYHYTYDTWGNIISITCEEPNESSDTKLNDDSTDNTSDIPDTSGNAVSNTDNNTSSGKSYNTSTVTMTSSSMTYDECNQMTSYNGEEVIYDNDGNMIYGPLDGRMVEFEYDCRNRLIRAGDTLYEYDAENNRIAVETPEYREEYVIDSSQELTRILEIERTYKKDSDREAERDTLYYGNGLVYEKNSVHGVLVYHFDHLGSTNAITDEAGEVVAKYSYGTYGELTEANVKYNDLTIRFLYNGQMGVITDENGLYYMRSRYYNPYIKRFINQDILTGTIGDNLSLNRYSYVEVNPVSYTDPFGLSPFFDPSVLIHTLFDVLGFLPGVAGSLFDLANVVMYSIEGNISEAIKSFIFMLPGLDMLGDAAKYAAKGGKHAEAYTNAMKLLTGIGALGSAVLSANEVGKGIAGMIDKYLVNNEKVTLALGIEVFFVLLYGYSTVKFAGFSLKLPKIFKEMDPNKLLDLVKNNKLHELIFKPK